MSKVYLVIAPEDREEFRTRFGHLIAFANAEVVDGGAERFDSVADALAKVPESVEFVAVHDAVRPLTPHPVIDAVFAAAAARGHARGAGCGHAQAGRSRDQPNHRDLPRDGVAGANAAGLPPRLDLRSLRPAHDVHGAVADDAQLVEALGHSIFAVNGSAQNFKITTRDDLDMAEALLKSKGGKKTESRTGGRFGDEAQW